MPDLLLRNLDDSVLSRLKLAAKKNGRSLQAELREILERASLRSQADTRRLSAKWLKRLHGAPYSDSTELFREDRAR